MDSPATLAPKGFFAEDLELPGIETNVDDLPAGFRLGSYVLEACIGRGAMATVYRARHSLLKSEVAVKLMKRTLLTSAQARHRFFREARAAAAIAHPHVVRITDAGTVNSLPYLVMEYLEGVELEQHIAATGGLPEAELIALALPLVAALAVVHDAGIVHRDLKPGNIFLARELGEDALVPKLIDFGVSKVEQDVVTDDMVATRFDQIVGSPLYVPPEGINGVGGLTARSDQYSFGIILYECATGRPPFVQGSLLALLNAIADGKFDPPSYVRPTISAGLEQVIVKAMSAAPERRYGDMRALGRALLELADDRAVARWSQTFGYEPSQRALSRVVLPAPPALTLTEPDEPFVRGAPANTTDVTSLLEPRESALAGPRALARRRRRTTTLLLGLTGLALLAYTAVRLGERATSTDGAPAELGLAPLAAEPEAATPGEAASAEASSVEATSAEPSPPASEQPGPAPVESAAQSAAPAGSPEPPEPARPSRLNSATDSKAHVQRLFFPPARKKSPEPSARDERVRVVNEAPILD